MPRYKDIDWIALVPIPKAVGETFVAKLLERVLERELITLWNVNISDIRVCFRIGEQRPANFGEGHDMDIESGGEI